MIFVFECKDKERMIMMQMRVCLQFVESIKKTNKVCVPCIIWLFAE